jgi:hypothetical protein
MEVTVARSNKSIRFSEDHQRLLELLSVFEQVTEGELIEHAIEAYVYDRSLAFRKTLGLSRDEIDVAPEAACKLVERLQQAMAEAIANGVHAKSEDEIKAELREAAERRRERARAGAAVPA